MSDEIEILKTPEQKKLQDMKDSVEASEQTVIFDDE